MLMLIIFRQFLLTFLVVMQFFAPLVHAHTHAQKSTFSTGLHLPELEVFATAAESVYIHNAASALDADSLCVSINTGIQHKSFKVVVNQNNDTDHNFCLVDAAIALQSTAQISKIYATPLVAQCLSPLVSPAFTPRAPPVA